MTIWRATNGTSTKDFDTFSDMMGFLTTCSGTWWAL